jgi:hypothetical protein
MVHEGPVSAKDETLEANTTKVMRGKAGDFPDIVLELGNARGHERGSIQQQAAFPVRSLAPDGGREHTGLGQNISGGA